MPGFGQSACAWAPAKDVSEKKEFIIVAFEKPQQIRQLHIHENVGAGSIDRIVLQDTDGKFHTVYANPLPGPLPEAGRFWNLPIDRTAYKVQALKLQLHTSAVRGYNQIDAIGISDSEEPYVPKIRQAKNIQLTAPPQNLGPKVNWKSEELCPVISPDGRTLYYTRMNHPDNLDDPSTQDIWEAEIDANGVAVSSKNIGRPLNNGFNSSLTSITPDGQTALLLNRYLPDGSMDNGISLSHKTEEGWSQPKDVAMDDYYNDNIYGEFCLSSSGKVMLLAIQRDDSKGSKDIYVSFRRDDATWVAPIPLPDNINTADSETSPYLAADDRTLYFSSPGHLGYGSKDMFVTRRVGDSWTEWTDPENLGPQLNTPGWDAYYSVPANGEYVYFVSYQDNGYGTADIYRAPLPEALRPKPVVLVRGKVTDKKTGLPLGTQLRYHSLSTGEEIGIAQSDRVTGNYSIVLPAGDLFGFSTEKDGYLPLSSSLDLKELRAYEEVRKDFEMSPMEKGATIVMNNIYFDTGEYQLRRESNTELAKLREILKANPGMRVEIGGHTDDVGTAGENDVLSRNRAQAVVAYLMKKGVDAKRLVAKGYGEHQPTHPNDSASNRQKNRRVEFKILEL